jgi:hypothetical protein
MVYDIRLSQELMNLMVRHVMHLLIQLFIDLGFLDDFATRNRKNCSQVTPSNVDNQSF